MNYLDSRSAAKYWQFKDRLIRWRYSAPQYISVRCTSSPFFAIIGYKYFGPLALFT